MLGLDDELGHRSDGKSLEIDYYGLPVCRSQFSKR